MRVALEGCEILFEDDALIVCRKDAGFPVQSRSLRQKDMVSVLQNYLSREVYVVQRLDQPVEGILLFAKTRQAAASLSRQIGDGSLEKIYLAVCLSEGTSGKPLPGESNEVCLVDYLRKDSRKNLSFVAEEGEPDAKRAELHYRIFDRIKISDALEEILAAINLKTGRHHQIRVQMAHAKLPLVGDQKYNLLSDEEQNLALCAVRLRFFHPVSGQRLSFETKPRTAAFANFEKK